MGHTPRRRWSAGRLTPFALAVAAVACAGRGARNDTPAQQALLPTSPFRLETVQWSAPYDGPLGYPKGAQRATLSVDPRTGGETYYARFPAGSHFEPHWHAHPEYAVVLRGKVIHTLGEAKSALEPGDYVVIPPRVNHGWSVDSVADAYLLIRRDGPADFNFVAR